MSNDLEVEFRLSEMGFTYNSRILQWYYDVVTSAGIHKMRIYIYILTYSDSYEISAYSTTTRSKLLLEGVPGYSRVYHIQLLEYLVSIGFVPATRILREYKIDNLIS